MADTRKQAVSLRVSTSDLRKVKKLAQRLDVRDSDVIRFALKTMLARLAPLCDHSVRGRALVPIFIEAGSDLFHHFDLDIARLEEIVNDGATKEQVVEPHDLHRLAIAGMQQAYATLQPNKLPPSQTGQCEAPPLEDPLNGHLRSYLYSKYVDVDLTRDPVSTK
jgi:hypothetical protein